MLGLSAAAMGLTLLGSCGRSGTAGSTTTLATGPSPAPLPASGNSTRLVHMTDLHIMPDKGAGTGVAKCLDTIAKLQRRPDVIVTGGDLSFDLFATGRKRCEENLSLLSKTFRDHCPAPVHHCLGNHDIWGWNKAKSQTVGTEPGWGKGWTMDTLAMKARYYHFDLPAWRVFVLDSVQPKGTDAYQGRIDPEQLAWLQHGLDTMPAGVSAVVVTHIPIISVCATFRSKPADELTLGNSESMGDARILHELFIKNGRVKLCLSGHIHQNERIDYQGVTYICDGAVCGSWWNGPKDRCKEGFGIIDLHANGSFTHEYVGFGWTPVT